jgi:hypothetical protein
LTRCAAAHPPTTISTIPSLRARWWLPEHERRDRVREQHLDQRERAHAGGGRDRKSEEPELRAPPPHAPARRRSTDSERSRLASKWLNCARIEHILSELVIFGVRSGFDG